MTRALHTDLAAGRWFQISLVEPWQPATVRSNRSVMAEQALSRPAKKAAMSRDRVLNAITARLVRDFAPERIILFGSRARGDYTPDSDYDLIVVMPEGVDRRATTVAIRRRLADLPAAKDIIVTTAADLVRGRHIAGSVADEASRQGVDVYVR
jgi:uncharacterized protein